MLIKSAENNKEMGETLLNIFSKVKEIDDKYSQKISDLSYVVKEYQRREK